MPLQVHHFLFLAQSILSSSVLLLCLLKRERILANFFAEGVLLSSVAKLSINDGQSSKIERYSPPFVRKGAQASIEDPFTTTARSSTQVTPTGPKSKGRAATSDNWRSGSSSPSSAGRSSPSPSSPSRYLLGKRGKDIFVKSYETEADVHEFIETITADEAQSLFPPACCVFVAK